jgi:hypothetical protein
MALVMFHSGRELPNYLESNFRQIRLFNPDTKIYFLTDHSFMKNPVFNKHDIIVLDKDLFYTSKISKFTIHFNYSKLPEDYQFWVITATRLMYIERFIRVFGLKDVYHFENDIMLYYNLRTHHEKFLKLYTNLAITVGGPDKCMTGLMFIKNCEVLELMTQFFVDSLKCNSRKHLMKQYGMDMVNEMTLMRAYSKEHPEQLQFLPILPFGEYSNNYNEFDSIFDPASWGMFVGGSAQELQPGIKPKDHYIGLLLMDHPEYSVIWKKDEENRNIPYFKYDDKEVRINNLHIHCKQLHKYASQ